MQKKLRLKMWGLSDRPYPYLLFFPSLNNFGDTPTFDLNTVEK